MATGHWPLAIGHWPGGTIFSDLRGLHGTHLPACLLFAFCDHCILLCNYTIHLYPMASCNPLLKSSLPQLVETRREVLLAGRNNQRSQVCAGGGVAPDSIKSWSLPYQTKQGGKVNKRVAQFCFVLEPTFQRVEQETVGNEGKLENVRFPLISGKKEKKTLLFKYYKREGRKV